MTHRISWALEGESIEATGLTTAAELDAIELDAEGFDSFAAYSDQCVDDNPFWESVDAATWDAQDHAHDMRRQRAIAEPADTSDTARALSARPA